MKLSKMSESELKALKNYPVSYRLQKLRWQNSLTQQEFAELIDCRQSSVSMWERGEYMPSERTLDKIISLYDLPEDFFQTGIEEKEDETVCV